MRILFAFVAALWMQAASAELVVVANKSVAVSSMKRAELSRIFLGQSGSFPDGSTAVPLDVSGDYRSRFYRDVLKRQPDQIEKYWARMIFTGKAQPPREVKLRDVKSLVAETPGAISYLDKSQVDASVKVIRVDTGS